MKRIPFLLFGLFFLRSASIAQSTDSIRLAVEKSANIFMLSKAAVGSSLGIYINGHAYTYNFGSVSKDSMQLPSAHTIYGIASITKTFTGLLLAKAAEENKMNRDDDIRKYLVGDYP